LPVLQRLLHRARIYWLSGSYLLREQGFTHLRFRELRCRETLYVYHAVLGPVVLPIVLITAEVTRTERCSTSWPSCPHRKPQVRAIRCFARRPLPSNSHHCVIGDSTVPLTASDCEPFVVKRTASRFGLVASMGQVSLPAHRSATVTVPLCTLWQVSGGAPCHPFL